MKSAYRTYFDKLANKYSENKYLSSDPIEFCYQYKDKRDIEIVGFISALFSYGNVVAIKKHLANLFQYMGKSPFAFIQKGDFKNLEDQITKYRFQTKNDILLFLKVLSKMILQKNTLESYFQIKKNPNAKLNERIVHFQKSFLDRYKEELGNTKMSYGFLFLIGSGKQNSAHKRYCMFLRWMVQDSFPDFGIYKSISKSDLVYPADVHIVRISSILGVSNRKSVDFKLAEMITFYFKEMNKEDPLLYDFSLSRLGILKECKAEYRKEICERCELKKVCNKYKFRILN